MEVVMGTPAPSENWKTEAVIDQLRTQARESGEAAAQIFLQGPDAGGDLAEVARKLVGAASGTAKGKSHKASIGRVSKLAKSFSLTADPEVFARLAKEPSVKAILPSQIDDVYPKPVKIVHE
jgi:hypothetical protein